ncbi:MAG: hypothetical protein QOF01_2630 [Thermomicrobiales bacterium]|jgi:hypothetical protein|nr:hypothetical protein [Thermomicrobiales bacterium]
MSRSSGKKRRATLPLVGIVAVVALSRWRLLTSIWRRLPLRSVSAKAAVAIDQTVGWHRLPVPFGLATLVGLRIKMREKNLYDTSHLPTIAPSQTAAGQVSTRYLTARSPDGTDNDLSQPAMGSAGTRFGRNVPLDHAYPGSDLLEPNPRTISRTLMTRETFEPATTINLLVASWIQFMVRDWISHGKSPKESPFELPLQQDDPWPVRPMRILRTPPDPTRPPGNDGGPPTYINHETHWWDGSQIYGSNAAHQAIVRSGEHGKLRVDADGFPVTVPFSSPEHPAKVPGFWVGLAMMQTLFTREHNAICDRFRAEYPSWSDDELFDHARLVNTALLAKIHTVEWTPAIISHPTTRIALRANWFGLQGERLAKAFGRLSGSEVFSGIPGSETDHFGVPYSLTEEFVAVYRMHPLIPDDFTFRSATDDTSIQERTFPELAGPNALEVLGQVPMADLFYSFGIAHPGAVQLHNFPRALQTFERPDKILVDLAATDILRMRELGVPRYNEFRTLIQRRPVKSFEELTDNPSWTEELRQVYDGDIDRVDLMVGMFAEPRPKGFGFSDTAFRIFILMASRRLNSDRFFTIDFTPQVYTQVGLDWIENNSMTSVLLRHFPALAPSLRNVENAFAPWTRTAA